MKLRYRLGKLFIKLGSRLYGESALPINDIPTDLQPSRDAVVENELDAPLQWGPEQHGNVIIVEPRLMNRYRRGKL